MLTCCDFPKLSEGILKLAGSTSASQSHIKDSGEVRMGRGEADLKMLLKQLERFNPFGRKTNDLACISANDVACPEIRDDLSVNSRG